jgi:DNA-binding NarL/FixJ family response regulator
MSIKIVVVDDHGIVRDGLRLLMEQQDDMEVIDEAADGREAVELVRKLKPDVVLMDVTMPGLNGIEATRQIVREDPNVKVLALSGYSNKGFVTDMLKAGASGYILKDSLAGELIRAINVVMAGQQYLCPQVTGGVVEGIRHPGAPKSEHPLLDRLTGKERELLQLLAENKSSKEAARLLHVSVKTVDARRRELMHKLGITGIAELTKFAIREGLTSLEF